MDARVSQSSCSIFGEVRNKMALLIRKISRSKWPPCDLDVFDVNQLQADTISGDLKTQKNTLSTWEIEDIDSLEEAVLALVSGSDKIDTMHVIAIRFDDALNNQLKIVSTEGNTPISELRGIHRDIADLNYKALGTFAKLVIVALKENRVKTFAVKELREILKKAIEQGRLKLSDVKPTLKEDIDKFLNKKVS